MTLHLKFHFFSLLFLALLINCEGNLEKSIKESTSDTKIILSQMYENLYGSGKNKTINIINKFKRELGEIPDFNGLIYIRIKSPLSIYKKFYSKKNYQEGWNSMKDLLGFMIIVDTHRDIDNILNYLLNKYSDLKNNNSELLVFDFRNINIRNKKKYDFNEIKNNYQTNNGYKTVRLNLLYEEYPIEIQIKTKEEYIAHKSTHNLIYKNTHIDDENIKNVISDALFPLIEVVSHKMIYTNFTCSETLEKNDNDLKLIFERNLNIYMKYKNIIDSALEMASIYIFLFKNQLYFNLKNLNDQNEEKILECNILKIIKYLSLEKESLLNYNFYISKIVYMDYKEFEMISSKLEDKSLLDSITIYSINDIIRSKYLKLIENLGKCYQEISIGIYNDELSKLFLGYDTIFSEDDRIKNMQTIKNINNTGIIDNFGNLKIVNYSLNNTKNKKYKLCYLPGVFDMYHPGHRIYIQKVSELCSEIIIGLKSSNYSKQFKNKEPVFNETERKDILLKVKGINDVYITNNDIQPDNKTLNELIKYSSKSAIFLGSDWNSCEKILIQIEKNIDNQNCSVQSLNDLKLDAFCKKSLVSFEQYIYLKKNYPKIDLIMVPRENSIHSSTYYRKNILQNIKRINNIEIQDIINI